jgi:hypothetical protein
MSTAYSRAGGSELGAARPHSAFFVLHFVLHFSPERYVPRPGSDACQPVGAQRRANASFLVGCPYGGFQDIWIQAVLSRSKRLAAGWRGRR